MQEHATRTRSTFGLAGFLLVLGTALGAQAEPPSSTLPGRKPDSMEPWGAFLGRAAHLVIGRQYRAQNPSSLVFLDPANLSTVKDGRVTLYRWSYRRKKPNASWKQCAAQQEEELPREEMEERGEWAEQALRAAYEGDELPNGFHGQVYLPEDCR